jgi:hypothetical protein
VFGYISIEQRVPKDNPLRALRAMVDEVRKEPPPEHRPKVNRLFRPYQVYDQLVSPILLFGDAKAVGGELVKHLSGGSGVQ